MTKPLTISDITLKLYKSQLTFRKKMDIAALFDRMKIPVIELGEMTGTTEDRLFIKTVAASVFTSTLAVSVGIDAALAPVCMESLKAAKHARLQVTASLSTARMEYVFHKKANEMLEAVKQAVAACKAVCDDVEFVADDATRTDFEFLKTVITGAIEAGAESVSFCDTAGNTLPDGFGDFIVRLRTEIPGLANRTLGVECYNELGMADASTVRAIQCGAGEIKASACHPDAASLPCLLKIFTTKVGDFPGMTVTTAENLAQPIKVITNLCNLSSDAKTPFEDGVRTISGDVYLTEQDSEENVLNEIQKLGYTLSDADREKVYQAFKRIVSKKNRIDLHELEVIVASEALQVPQTYLLENSIVTTGNKCDALAHIKLSSHGKILDGISLGNGSVDASFLAIEKITGCHYELDDFQIQAITEGKEAMGQTLVKLRSHGKVYSGKGVSTDIVISAIEAYLNALNKIVYEEEQA